MSRFASKLPYGVQRLFRLPLSRDRLIRDMDEELAAHFAMRVEDLRRLGMSEADADAEARRRFGDPGDFRDYAARRAARRARRLEVARLLEECAQDLRAAARQLRRTPALSAIVMLTLAVSIGATTAVYGVVHHLLLAPLPYPDGNRIVSLATSSYGDDNIFWNVSMDVYRLWAARSRTLEDFAVYSWEKYPLGASTRDGAPQDTVKVAVVTPSFLPMLRVRPFVGRGFFPDDARRGAPAVALLSSEFWRARFAGTPDAIGRSVTVNGVPRTIVGIVPRGVGAPVPDDERPEVDIWLPLNVDSARGGGAFARLRPGVTSAAAARELDAMLHTLPDTGRLHGKRGEARTAADRVEPQRRRSVEVLFVAAGALLLIACADVAGLLLMRGWARRREFAIRQSLGAGRGRLARMLLTESLLLALPSGALGLLFAWLGLRPSALGYFAETRLDSATLLWTAVAALGTVLLFGVGPAFFAWERSLDVALRTGGVGGGASRATGRTHAGLVVGQIALSLVVLAAAGVLARSFVALVRTQVGYEPHGLLDVSVQRARSPEQQSTPRLTPAARTTALRTLRETFAATPGVSDVAIGTVPMTNYSSGPTAVDGPSGVRPSDVTITGMAFVSPEYFRVTRIPLVRGRGFDANASAAAGEIIVNQTLARHFWGDRDPVGARLRFGDGTDAEWLTVVGIAGDVRMPGGHAAEMFGLQMYRPATAGPASAGSFLLRARGDPATLRPVLARAVERAGIGATLANVADAASTLEYVYRGPRYALWLFGAFALFAVGLSAVGLFGIVAFAVARGTREIGIRVALGADSAALTRAILGQSLKLVAVGCAIGLLGAYGAARALTALVYGVSATDPVALGGAVLLLAVVALAASAVPVRRALRIDPMDTLRAE
jgi:putative ABC transport system permease protein